MYHRNVKGNGELLVSITSRLSDLPRGIIDIQGNLPHSLHTNNPPTNTSLS